MSNRYVGGYISSTLATANNTYATGVWTLKQYKVQLAAGNWPLFERYSFSNLNPISINEGANTTFSVNTTNVLTGTQLYWSILHNTSNSFDFISTGNTFTVTNNVGSFSVQTVADISTEGSESFRLQIQKTDANGEVLLTSGAITLADTSLSPLPSIDFLLVGGGGSSFKPSNIYQFPGGAGGAGVFQAIGFTKYLANTNYTVTISAGSGGASIFTGLFDQTFDNSAGGSLTMYGTGGGTGAVYSGTNGVSTTSANNGGGAAAKFYAQVFSGITRYYVESLNQAAHSQQSFQSTYNFSNQFPGVFTNYGGTGGTATLVRQSVGQTNPNGMFWAGGGGGGASDTRTNNIINNYNTNINGGHGMLSSITGTPTYYGGGGAGAAKFFNNGLTSNFFGSGGLGGGASFNQFSSTNGTANLGGGGSNGGTGGSGVMIFRFLDSQLSATGGFQYLDGEYRVVIFYTSGTIRFSRK